MTELLIGLGGLGLIGLLLLVWFTKQSAARATSQVDTLRINYEAQRDKQQQLLDQQLSQLTEATVRRDVLEQQLTELKQQYQHDMATHLTQIQQLQAQLTSAAEAKAAAETALQTLQANQAEWKNTLWREWTQHFESFSVKTLKSIQEDLEHKSKVTFQDNEQRIHQSIDTMLKPLTELVKAHEQKVKELGDQTLKETASLKEQIKLTVEQTEKLVMAKNHIVDALTNSKGRGDWGELELIRLLEDSGLQKGPHYEFQATQNDNSRPDISIKLPNGHQLFIDAKSLVIPLEQMQAAQDNPELEAQARKKLLQSLKEEIKKLYDRAYQSKQNDSLDFVILYVPRESMLRIPLEEDPTLIQEAFRKKVILASPLILMALLKTVAQGWHQATLSKHAEEIQVLGKELHKRAVRFLGHFDKLGQSLHGLTQTYEDADRALKGRQGMVGQLKKFEQLGCRSDKPLPERFDTVDVMDIDLIPSTDDPIIEMAPAIVP